MPTFNSLYKRRLGSKFDWANRKFEWGDQSDDGMPYTIWMSDDPQERLMMWDAAKRCRGKVLCGGLGLGVFPQLALSLPQVESVHIIEMDPDIIKLTTGFWNDNPWPGMSQCKVSNDTIENYLCRTDEKYDTVYIDTWDALYHEYLPHINVLATMSQRVLRDSGEILLWGYSMMIQMFLSTTRDLYDKKHEYCTATDTQIAKIELQYPLLLKLVLWMRSHPRCNTYELLEQALIVATTSEWERGILKIADDTAAQDLVDMKYFSK